MSVTKIIQYGDDVGKVTYIKRVQNKSIRISVNGNGEVKVTLPYNVRFSVAEAFLAEKMEWIVAHRAKALGRKVLTEDSDSPEEKDRKLEELRRKARKILPERIRAVYELMTGKIIVRNSLGLRVKDPFRYNRLAIKNNATNWGSCSSLRNINLNMHLVELPPELMDFVIAHELCHLVYRNHGPKFHKMLDAVTDGHEKELNRRLGAYRPK